MYSTILLNQFCCMEVKCGVFFMRKLNKLKDSYFNKILEEVAMNEHNLRKRFGLRANKTENRAFREDDQFGLGRLFSL